MLVDSNPRPHGDRRAACATPISPFSSIEVETGLLRQAFADPAVSDAALWHVATSARRVRCAPGPLALDSPCRPEPAWWLVRRGSISVGAGVPGDSFVEKRCIGPGEWLDVAGALCAPGTWIDQAVCRTPSELLCIPLTALLEACARDVALARAFAGVLAERVRDLSERLDDLAGADAPVRFARWLLRQVGPVVDELQPVRLVLRQRKRSIARQLCTTSETLSRTLRRLSDAGVVEVRDYELTIRDVAALRTLAHPAGTSRRVPQASALHRRAAQHRSAEDFA